MNAYRAYRQTQVETASPERTLALLVEGALSRIRKGITLLEQGKRADAAGPLTRAADIVMELERTLRPDVAPDLCRDLANLYQFVTFRLTRAATGDLKAARDAEVAFAPIAEGFIGAIEKTKAGR